MLAFNTEKESKRGLEHDQAWPLSLVLQKRAHSDTQCPIFCYWLKAASAMATMGHLQRDTPLRCLEGASACQTSASSCNTMQPRPCAATTMSITASEPQGDTTQTSGSRGGIASTCFAPKGCRKRDTPLRCLEGRVLQSLRGRRFLSAAGTILQNLG